MFDLLVILGFKGTRGFECRRVAVPLWNLSHPVCIVIIEPRAINIAELMLDLFRFTGQEPVL